MAATVVKKSSSLPLGDHQMAVFEVDLDGVTEYDFAEKDHGFSNIISAHFNNETTEGDGKLEKNYTVANAVLIGNIALTGFTSGDVVTVTIIGN